MSDWNPCPLCKASGAKQAKHCATNPACTWHHCHECRGNYRTAPKESK